ncbi:caspase, EACC1-associated type [Nostoc sp. MS1]|uniref:caspase, EACC1-associated type n=1 Tax=Nostoc sp. MS1 TaxID=2764711 RepID=UPI001CC768E8|nr:SUMF1/EgtB/PvdO family nonheme iron enzyme [Nostoc sp. MS1]BCL36797.1 hypothetical protein NSMS1_32440 [Nostoc sp. MS1]
MAKVALLIGISEYQEGLTPLPKAVNDVEAMRRILVNPEMGGFAEADVTVLKNPERQQMETAIFQLYANCQKDDLVLFYFSGHGVTVENGDFYFSTRITKKDKNKLILPTAVDATNVHKWMNQSKSKRQVVILDCCFSGAFAKGLTAKDDGIIDLQKYLGGEGRAILTASTSTQYAFESDGYDLSIYTHYLIQGIEKGAADQDGDGLIAVDELHGYAKSKVQEASPAMSPEFYPTKEGYRIFLAKSPKDDPKLKYRREVNNIAIEDEGDISALNRISLNFLRNNLGLSTDEADAIDFEVLEPYRKRQEKLQIYEQALSQIQRYPLSDRERNALKRLQNVLNFRDEDITQIEQRVLAAKQAEYQHQQQEVEKLRQEQEAAELQKQQAEKLRQEQEVAESSRKQAELQEQQEKKLSILDIPTKPCEFDRASIIINSGFLGFGKKLEIKRSRGQAQYFTEHLGNGVVIDMVAIPGGQFLMGSPENEPQRSNAESPQHKVTVQPFFMGKFPITQAQWKAIAALNKVNIDLKHYPSNFKSANRPVESVSWYDAVEFCLRLAAHTNIEYRLPSEAEWEYACRAGTTTPFHFGETITSDLANYNANYTYGAGVQRIYRQQTTEVGSFGVANAFGLYDMHGNVWEWCLDDLHKDYQVAPIDGSPWFNDMVTERSTTNDNLYQKQGRALLRGGSWVSNPNNCRSASRDYIYRDKYSYSIGFRVVCAVERILR